MDERIGAIRRLRTLAVGYAARSVTLRDFVAGVEPETRRIFPFGPYGWQMDHSPPPLGAELEAEVAFYIKWSHHHRDEHYRRSDWTYGNGAGPYDWLDEGRYHADFCEAFQQVRLGPLPDGPEKSQ